MVRRFIIVLCVFAVAALAQNTAVPLAETDSVAYYEEMYAYNYQKFRADESVADAFFWTSVTLSALAPVSAMLLGARSMGCNVNGDNDCSASALDIGIAVPLLLFLPSWITYGSFTVAKNIRKKNYNLYYMKKEDYIKRRELENGGTEVQSLSVQVLPLANPVDNCYGILLALNF